MDGRAFLLVAKALSGASHSEPEWRTAQGRAYYALFNHVRETMSGIRPTLFGHDGKDHVRAAGYLKKMPIADLKLVGQALENLKKARHDADYEMTKSVTQPDAVLVVGRAEKEIHRFDGVAPARLQGAVLAVARHP